MFLLRLSRTAGKLYKFAQLTRRYEIRHLAFSHCDNSSHWPPRTKPTIKFEEQVLKWDGVPTIGRQMVQDGVLDVLKINHADGHEILEAYKARYNEPRDLHNLCLSFTMLLKLQKMVHKNCPRCLYLKSRCLCSLVNPVEPYHKLWLFQHIREYGRNNNSGSLLCLVAGARRSLRGSRDQEDEMLEHIEQNINSTMIVFPSDDSITLPEFRRQRRKQLGNDAQMSLVLLDGTPREAANMERFLPPIIPRVRLRKCVRSSWFHSIRKQSTFERVCTAQGMFNYQHLIST